MAVRWRCPGCGADSILNEGQPGVTVGCEECGREIRRAEALCFLCDAPDGVRPRDSIHVQCFSCGEMQMIWAPVKRAL